MFARVAALMAFGFLTLGAVDDSYKVESVKEGPPASLASAVKGSLDSQGYRVLDPQGKPFADFWLRKGTPASGKPAGPKAAVLYPILADGELIGVVKFASEAHDYRDQTIAPGVYTLRYALQPVNGDHLGVSTYRDYALLLPAAKDDSLEDLPRKKLEQKSAESAGSSHPAVFLLQPPPENSGDVPSIYHDENLMTWGAVVELPLAVKGEASTVPLRMQIVVSGIKGP